MRRFYKESLQHKILFPFLILIVLTSVSVSSLSYYLNIHNTTEQLSRNVESQMVQLNDTFNMFFDHTANMLERFSINEMVTNDPVDHENDVFTLFEETVDTASSIGAVYTGTADGEVIMYPEPELEEDFDVRERSWYIDAVEAEGEVIWTEPYIDAATGEMIVSAAKAYYHGDELAGVVGTDVNITTLIDMTESIQIGETGYAVIIDQEGRYLVHPEQELVGEEAAYFQSIQNAGEQGLIEHEAGGEEQVIGYAANETTGWTVGGIVNVKDFEEQAKAIMLPTAISLGIILLIAIILSLVVTRKMTKPIKVVMERMQHIAKGNLNFPPLETKHKDEIGQLIVSTNEMNESMRQLLTKIQAASNTLTTQSEEISHSANEVKEGTEQVSATMQELASASETEANNTSSLSSLMQGFTKRIEALNQHGDYIRNSSNEVLEITQEGSKLMDASKGQMDKIDQIVQDAVRKVEGLDEQTQQISKLVSVIQDVAEQTNLLALNASIEAARAGEHGRGFAVVADEVRKLAEQVSASIADITGIVTNIQSESNTVSKSLQEGYKEVEQGTKQIEDTNEKFQDIYEAINQMITNVKAASDNMGSIAKSSQRMNESVEEIAAISEQSAAGIEETSASAEQITASMEEVSASLHDLTKLADELDETVGKFKL